MCNLIKMSRARGRGLVIGVSGCRLCGQPLPDSHSRGWILHDQLFEKMAAKYICPRCWFPYDEKIRIGRKASDRPPPGMKGRRNFDKWYRADFLEWLARHIETRAQRQELRR